MRRSKWTGLSFLLPGFYGVAGFFSPAVYGCDPPLLLCRRSVADSADWKTIVSCYITVHFLLAVKNTLRFLLVCLPLLLGISLVLAFLLHAWQMAFHQKQRLLKAAYLVPMAIPAASLVLLWKLMFDKHGFVNGILHFVRNPCG